MISRNLPCLLLAALVSLTACGGAKTPVDGGAGGGGGSTGGCLDDTDCPDPQLFFCNTTTSVCEPSCHNKSDCTNRGQYALDYCTAGLGCQCDEGKCVGSLCSADADCGASQVCRSGACVTAPAASTVASCQLSPDFVVVKAGGQARFAVTSLDAAGNAVVVAAADVAWSAPAGSPLTAPATATGLGSTFVAGSTPTTGTAAVAAAKATIGAISCQGKAIVLPAAPGANEVYAVVTDELSGRPVVGADVVLSLPDGTIVQQGAPAAPSVKTDARGLAILTLAGSPASYSVTSFDPDHSYLTIAGYTGTSRYLSMVTRRNQTDKYGGYTGTFKNAPTNSNVHAGIAGMSLAGSITNLSLSQLLGPSVPTDISIGTTINAPGVKLPAGVFLGFGAQKIKDSIAGQGLAGVCYLADGSPDEASIASGSCGVRSAWGLAGDVPLAALPLSALTGTGPIDFGAVFAQVLPIFKTFSSSVVRDVKFTLKTTPMADGGYVFSDQSQFTTVNHDFAQVPLAFSFAAKLPDLPKYRAAYVDAAAVIGGASVPGRGVVPLGIGLGVNTDNNAQIDKQGSYASAGLVQVRMAPSHHGLEGSTYGLLVAALSTKALGDPSVGFGASAIFARLPNNKLIFDLGGTSPVDLSGLKFPVFPEGARFNPTDTATPGLPARSFRLAASTPAIDLTGLDVVRISFGDALDHHWDVLIDPAGLAAGFTLPKPPGASSDRLFSNGLQSGSRSDMLVQALRLNTTPSVAGGTEVTFTGFVEVGPTNADRTTELLTGFSVLDFGAPTVAFTAPATSPAPLMKGAKVSMLISKFKLGTTADADGVVKLSFSLGGQPVSGCADQVFNAETTAGKGTIDYTLPPTCLGTSLTMRADLLRIDGQTPIAPAVWDTRTVTIQ